MIRRSTLLISTSNSRSGRDGRPKLHGEIGQSLVMVPPILLPSLLFHYLTFPLISALRWHSASRFAPELAYCAFGVGRTNLLRSLGLSFHQSITM